jgi:hypothetical protein
MLLVRWAANNAFASASGTPVFIETKQLALDFNAWVHDSANDVSSSEPINYKSVVAALAGLYKEQHESGAAHGIERRAGDKATLLWHIARAPPPGGGSFERECRKLFLRHIHVGKHDTNAARDARKQAALMTPQRAADFVPTNVRDVVNALHGSCVSAPLYATLISVARRILLDARALAQDDVSDPANVSMDPPATPSRVGAYSPDDEGACSGLSPAKPNPSPRPRPSPSPSPSPSTSPSPSPRPMTLD